MEHKKHITYSIFAIAMLWAVDFVTASRVIADRRLSMEENGHVGHDADICAAG
ncbi:hypothetical protein Hanom_Chr09g00779371 [Helianthus anomalus]